ncbi:MAG: class I SAM-dependent methyltransferase [Pseudomonadota bacterium]
MQEDVRRAYDVIGPAYAAAREAEASTPFLARLDHYLAPDSMVLDLGCGAGLPVDAWLLAAGHRVIGLDISDTMLDMARANIPGAEYRRGDLSALCPSTFAADAIVSFFALFHVDRERHAGVLANWHTQLAPGGYLLLTTGCTDWEGAEAFFGARMRWSHFDVAAYRRMLPGAGFRILEEGQHPVSGSCINQWHPVFLAQAI